MSKFFRIFISLFLVFAGLSLVSAATERDIIGTWTGSNLTVVVEAWGGATQNGNTSLAWEVVNNKVIFTDEAGNNYEWTLSAGANGALILKNGAQTLTRNMIETDVIAPWSNSSLFVVVDKTGKATQNNTTQLSWKFKSNSVVFSDKAGNSYEWKVGRDASYRLTLTSGSQVLTRVAENDIVGTWTNSNLSVVVSKDYQALQNGSANLSWELINNSIYFYDDAGNSYEWQIGRNENSKLILKNGAQVLVKK